MDLAPEALDFYWERKVVYRRRQPDTAEMEQSKYQQFPPLYSAKQEVAQTV